MSPELWEAWFTSLGVGEVGEDIGDEVLEVAGDESGVIVAVERRDDAMVRRICDSVLSVAAVTQATNVRISLDSTTG